MNFSFSGIEHSEHSTDVYRNVIVEYAKVCTAGCNSIMLETFLLASVNKKEKNKSYRCYLCNACKMPSAAVAASKFHLSRSDDKKCCLYVHELHPYSVDMKGEFIS